MFTLAVFTSLALSLATCQDGKWVWSGEGRTQYSTAKALLPVAQGNRPLFQLTQESSISPSFSRNKDPRYAVYEEPFENQPSNLLGKPGDFIRPGFDSRPNFGNRPNFGSQPDPDSADRPLFNNRGPEFGPGFENNPGFINAPGVRPGFSNNRPGFQTDNPNFGRPGFQNPGPGFEGPFMNRPNTGFQFRPRPSHENGRQPEVLTGPIPSWQRPPQFPNNDPTNFDTCKCTHAFNCKSPGIQFGTCDVGKQYCCYNSPKYGLSDGSLQTYGNKNRDGRRPAPIGPETNFGPFNPDNFRVEPRGILKN